MGHKSLSLLLLATLLGAPSAGASSATGLQDDSAPAPAARSAPALIGPRDAAARSKALRRHGGGRETEAAVELGLQWLQRHARAEGGWDADGFHAGCQPGERCEGVGKGQHGEEIPCPFDDAISALGALAFLGHGHHPAEVGDPRAALVARTLDGLREPRGFFALCLATQAFAEAAVLGGRAPDREHAQTLARRLLEQRGPDGAFGYAARFRPGSDVPSTALAVQALLSAQDAGVALPEDLGAAIDAFLDSLEEDDGALAYLLEGRRYGYTPTTSNGHCAAAIRALLDVDTRGRRHLAHRQKVLATRPEWKLEFRDVEVPGRGTVRVQTGHLSLYQWWYGTLACFHEGGASWRKWSAPLRRELVDAQCKQGCARGSWNPEGTYERQTGGRVFATALGVLMLEQPYRHLPR